MRAGAAIPSFRIGAVLDLDLKLRAKIKNSSIVIASGQHDLNFIEMTGRLQIDLYNYYLHVLENCFSILDF